MTSPKAVYFVASGSTMYVMDIARVTQPDIGPGTSFTDKHSNRYILQSLMKIDASVEVKVPQLKRKKKKEKAKPQREKIFLHDQKKSRKSLILTCAFISTEVNQPQDRSIRKTRFN